MANNLFLGESQTNSSPSMSSLAASDSQRNVQFEFNRFTLNELHKYGGREFMFNFLFASAAIRRLFMWLTERLPFNNAVCGLHRCRSDYFRWTRASGNSIAHENNIETRGLLNYRRVAKRDTTASAKTKCESRKSA